MTLGGDLSAAARDGRLRRRHGAALLRAAALRHACSREAAPSCRGRRRRCSRFRRRSIARWPVLLLIPFLIAAFAAWVTNTDEGRRVWSATAARAARRAHAPPLRARRPLRAARRRSARRRRAAAHGARRHDRVDRRPDRARRRVRIRTRVREGSSLRAAVAESTLFPPMLAQLIGVGEDAGQLRVFLMKAADIFEERTERATQRLATLAEPAMIVIFGVDRGVRRAVAAAGDLRHQRELVQMMRAARGGRRGFTLWELTMVLLVMAIAAIARRAGVRALRHRPADGGADGDARPACATRAKRRSTSTRRSRCGSIRKRSSTRSTRRGVSGSGRLADGHARPGPDATLVTRSSRGCSTCSGRRAPRSPTPSSCAAANVPLDRARGPLERSGACRLPLDGVRPTRPRLSSLLEAGARRSRSSE